MSFEAMLNTSAVHKRATVTFATTRETIRTWETLGLVNIAVFPDVATIRREFGTELECDAVAYAEADEDIRPGDDTSGGARDRLMISVLDYDVIAVVNVGVRDKHKALALKRVS